MRVEAARDEEGPPVRRGPRHTVSHAGGKGDAIVHGLGGVARLEGRGGQRRLDAELGDEFERLAAIV